MRKSLVELGKLVKNDIEVQESFLETVKGSENTQIKELTLEVKARKEAMEAVLHYILTGSKLYFQEEE